MGANYPIISADDPIEGPFKDLNIVIAREEHHDAILKHTREVFGKDEPVGRAIGGNEEYDTSLVDFINSGLVQNNGQCLVALDPKTNEVAGFRVSKIVTKELEDQDAEESKTAVHSEMFRHLLQMVDVELCAPIKNPYEMFNVDKLVEYRGLSVGDKYRQMGLGYEMLLRSLRLAKKDGFKIIRGTFSSSYSRKSAEKLGFKAYNEIFHDDYKVNGEVLLKNMGPHPSLVLMIKEL